MLAIKTTDLGGTAMTSHPIRLFRLPAVLLVPALLLTCTQPEYGAASVALSTETTDEELALDAVENFIQTFNSRNPSLWAASLHYPHVRPSPRSSQRVTESAEQYGEGVDCERTVAAGTARARAISAADRSSK